MDTYVLKRRNGRFGVDFLVHAKKPTIRNRLGPGEDTRRPRENKSILTD